MSQFTEDIVNLHDNNWKRHTYPGAISFHKHLGSARHAERHLLQQRTIVFTTYATVVTEYCRGDNALAKINWFRIVLDEGKDMNHSLLFSFLLYSILAIDLIFRSS